MKSFTEIKGMFDQKRLVRLGSIRLGLKKKTAKGVEYPTETNYFVCPPEVQAVYGKEPKEMEIQIASADRSLTIPYSYTLYGSGAGVKCKGNGETANEKQKDGTWKEITCPCKKLETQKNGCKMRGHFQFIIPAVNLAACFQLSTTSFRSVSEILNGLDCIESFFRKPCDQIPLYPDDKEPGKFRSPIMMRRIEGQTHHDDKKQTHYPVQIYPKVDPKYVNFIMECNKKILVSLPAPKESNPIFDAVDVIEEKGIIDEEDLKNVTPSDSDSRKQIGNKASDTPELPPEEETKKESTTTPPAEEKAVESQNEVKMSTLDQQSSIHMLSGKAKIDVYEKYGVESTKDFTYDKAEKVKKELSDIANEQVKNKKKAEPKQNTKKTDIKDKDLPKTIEECRLAISSFVNILGLDEEKVDKDIEKMCGENPTLPQLHSIYKQFANKAQAKDGGK